MNLSIHVITDDSSSCHPAVRRLAAFKLQQFAAQLVHMENWENKEER